MFPSSTPSPIIQRLSKLRSKSRVSGRSHRRNQFSMSHQKRLPSAFLNKRSNSMERSKLNTSKLRRQSNHEVLLETMKQKLANADYSNAVAGFTSILKEDSSCIDALYSRGISYMHLNQHRQALPDLRAVCKENPLYDKQLYVALSMCNVALGDLPKAIQCISKGLYKFPKFAEGFVIRGQLFNKQEEWAKAISDFKRCIRLVPLEGTAYIGLADSLQGLGDTSACFKLLTQAISNSNASLAALLKRGKLYFNIKNYIQALEDFDRHISYKPDVAEAYFYRGLALYEQQEFTEASLAFEQTIKYDTEGTFVGVCVFHIGAIKVKEKDFYGAIHCFKRVLPGQEVKDQKTLQHYAGAVVSLMKRKFKEGIQSFTNLLKSEDPIIKEFRGNCHAFRGYGYCALRKHSKAKKDFNVASSFGSLDKASQFNYLVARAVMRSSNKDSTKTIKILHKASELFPKNPDPLLYQAALLLQKACKDSYDLSDLSKSEEVLCQAIEARETESESYFFRGILRYLLGQFSSALEDIRTAIDKAEDNLSEHYLMKGLCQASLQEYSDAVQDFSIALQLKETLHEAHYFRGRAAFLMEDNELAFSDFQKLLGAYPEDPKVHIKAGNLLLLLGSYTDAIKAYQNSINIKPTNEASLLISKCHILRGNLNDFIESTDKSTNMENDKLIAEIIRTLPKDFKKGKKRLESAAPGTIFSEKHLKWFIGVSSLYLGSYDEALSAFQGTLEIIHRVDPSKLSPEEGLIAEEENCELLYNISICHIFGDTRQALTILTDLADVLSTKHKAQMMLLTGILHIKEGEKDIGNKIVFEARACDEQAVDSYFRKKDIIILPLNTGNEFASGFPSIQIPYERATVQVRPAVSLPRVKTPRFDFQIEAKAKDLFVVQKVTPKPEAPWLNRNKDCIQFTDSLVEIETCMSEDTQRKSSRNSFEEEIKEIWAK